MAKETGEKVDEALEKAREWAREAERRACISPPAVTPFTAMAQMWTAIAKAELMAHILGELQKATMFPRDPK